MSQQLKLFALNDFESFVAYCIPPLSMLAYQQIYKKQMPLQSFMVIGLSAKDSRVTAFIDVLKTRSAWESSDAYDPAVYGVLNWDEACVEILKYLPTAKPLLIPPEFGCVKGVFIGFKDYLIADMRMKSVPEKLH